MSLRTAESPAAVRTAVLMTHSDADDTAAAVAAAVAAADRHGCRLLGDPDELEKHSGVGSAIESTETLAGDPDLCLVLGGDGTLLRALGRFAAAEVPVFGINYGTIGFLAAAEREALEEGLELALAGRFEVVQLPGLDALIEAETRLALNDVSFIRRPHARVAELSYRLGGQEVGHVRCDGLVAATPTGSTGYNLANSGPILAWGVEGYVVSFIAPHTLTARALVVAPDDILHVRNEGRWDAVDIALDGEPVAVLEPGAEVEVRFRDIAGRLAQLPGSNFYRRMRDKFGRLAY
jgi:NAD+ kinase